MIFAVVVVMAAAIVTGSEDLSSLLALDASQVMNGELWRLFSGHLAHLSWRQFAVDAPVFIPLYAIHSKRAGVPRSIALSLFAALCVSGTVVLTGIHEVYGGLSGLSCAAVSAILLSMIMGRSGGVFPYLMAIGYGTYLLFAGGAASGVRVAQEAHIAGAVSGLVFALFGDAKSPWKNR